MQRIQITHILKPRGLRGELKCALCDVAIPKNVYIDAQPFSVQSCSNQNGFTYLTLSGICDATAAERLRGKAIEIDREHLTLAADEILTADLIGFTIVDEHGKPRGHVRRVENYGAGDIIECGNLSFPYEDAFIIETDTKKRTLVVRSFILE